MARSQKFRLTPASTEYSKLSGETTFEVNETDAVVWVWNVRITAIVLQERN